ncbi:MAG TPA: hypothetical protein VN256_26500 [Pyrinomonadaceae bacterium]|nr:hypothetical protein [Pyrinomonadaceae bacterium]
MKNSTYLSRHSRRLLWALVASLLLAAASTPAALATPPAQPLFAPREEEEEYIRTYASDCATVKIFYAPGDKVCVEAGNFVALNIRPRRFQWVAPDGRVVELKDISTDPGFDIIELPEAGEFAQAGKWTVRTIGRTSSVKARGGFIVRRPFFVQIDLGINLQIPEVIQPLDRLDIEFHMFNDGPDDAPDVEFVSEVPTNMTFVGMRQLSGPEFECVTPKAGDKGTITCRATRGLALDEAAAFQVQYQVNAEVREGEVCTGVSRISSSIRDFNEWDNTVEARTTVVVSER